MTRGSFLACFEAKESFNEGHSELIKTSLTQELSTGGGWSNETMTDATLALFAEECQEDGGRFVATELAVLDCTTSKIAYHNVGDCFPPVSACADYTLGTFVTDTINHKLSLKCSLRTEIQLEKIPEQSPTPAPRTLPPAGRPDPKKHTDDQRMACRQSMNEYSLANEDYDKAYSNYLDHRDVVYGKIWHNETYLQSAMEEFSEACDNVGGRFGSFTGVLDCVGFGEFNNQKHLLKGYEHVGECFAPGRACDAYTSSVSAWLIDTAWVMNYNCLDVAAVFSPNGPSPQPMPLQSPTSAPRTSSPKANNTPDSVGGGPSRLSLFVMVIIILGGLVYVVQRRYRKRDYDYTTTTQELTLGVEMSEFQDDVIVSDGHRLPNLA